PTPCFYTLSLHDALPISASSSAHVAPGRRQGPQTSPSRCRRASPREPDAAGAQARVAAGAPSPDDPGDGSAVPRRRGVALRVRLPDEHVPPTAFRARCRAPPPRPAAIGDPPAGGVQQE